MNEKTILLIEDNPDDALLTLRAFKKNNIPNRVVVYHDGATALDYLFATGHYAQQPPHPRPELILLDLRLPKMDGIEVLRRLRANQHTRSLPIIILTTSDERQDILQCYNMGANSYLRKPVNFTQFTETIRQVSNYWLHLNVSPPP